MALWLSPGDVVVDLECGEVRNVCEVPLPGDADGNSSCFLPAKLEEAWKTMGSNVAMIHGYSGRQLRFSELLLSVRQLANAFQAEGLCERMPQRGHFCRTATDEDLNHAESGETITTNYVLVLSNNSIEVYVAIFALSLAECTAILADTSWTFGRIVDVIHGRSITVVVADGASRALATQLIASPLCSIKRALYTDDPLSIPAMMTFRQTSTGSSTKQTDHRAEDHCETGEASNAGQCLSSSAEMPPSTAHFHQKSSRNCRNRPLFVAFTSGATNGEPKPVEISHFTFLTAVATSIYAGLYGEPKHVLVWSPPNQLSGLLAVYTSLLSGARVVIVPEKTAPTDPKQIAYICRNHKVSTLVGSPDVIRYLLKEELKDHFEGISSVLTLPEGYIPRRDTDILSQITNFFGLDPYQLRVVYGTVETTGPVLLSTELRGGPTRGFPLPGIKVRVLAGSRRGSERIACPGEEGEIIVRGRTVAQKYWPTITARYYDRDKASANGPNNSENFTCDGWFRTGDLGFFDERGRVTVLGSLEDLVPVQSLFGRVRQSRMVHSSVFEVFLLQQAGVNDVKVISVPHGTGSPPDVVACIVPEDGIDDAELAAHLHDTIERAMYPLNRVQRVYMFDELPRSSWKRRSSRKMILAHILQTTTL